MTSLACNHDHATPAESRAIAEGRWDHQLVHVPNDQSGDQPITTLIPTVTVMEDGSAVPHFGILSQYQDTTSSGSSSHPVREDTFELVRIPQDLLSDVKALDVKGDLAHQLTELGTALYNKAQHFANERVSSEGSFTWHHNEDEAVWRRKLDPKLGGDLRGSSTYKTSRQTAGTDATSIPTPSFFVMLQPDDAGWTVTEFKTEDQSVDLLLSLHLSLGLTDGGSGFSQVRSFASRTLPSGDEAAAQHERSIKALVSGGIMREAANIRDITTHLNDQSASEALSYIPGALEKLSNLASSVLSEATSDYTSEFKEDSDE